jgi:hypothetical protein
VATIDASSALAARRARPDLTQRLAEARAMVTQFSVTVAVVGEFKRGKSTLINALLQTAACPVHADIVTGTPTRVSYGDKLQVIVHRHKAGEVDEEIEDVPFADLTALVSERADDRPSDVRSVEVRMPHRLLRSGLSLLDTPGVGGLESVHGQLSLASLNTADAVVVVTDASQELTEPELDFLMTAIDRCPQAALVVTKIDLHQQWRRMVEADRAHLATAGIEIPVFPVSSFLRLRASRDPRLNAESGFAPLVGFLAGVLDERLSRHAGSVAHDVDFVAKQLAHENDAERLVLARPRERERVVEHLGAAHQRARSLTAPSAAWQQVLSDGIQDLVADVEHDLAARLRMVNRDVRDIIDESDPRDTWEETQAWLRRQVAESGVANRDLLLRRARELSDSVAERFSFEAGEGVELELDSVAAALATLELPSASTFEVQASRLGSLLASGRLAAYVPLMALSVALNASLATAVLIMPPAAILGAVVGWKLSRAEGNRQRTQRQTQAKAAAHKFVDEVAFEMNKSTRDGLRRTQRRLRDEFQSRASTIQTSTSAALAAARRASNLPADEGMARAAKLDQESYKLGRIRQDLRSLNAGRA